MTAVPANPRVSELRELLRHLADFRATFEATGLDVVRTPSGAEWSLWDLEYLLQESAQRLTVRQRQAITLCLVHGVKEVDAARLMGLSPTNPVSMYATLGLQRLLDMIDRGELTRFNRPVLTPAQAVERHIEAVRLLAKEIEAQLFEIDGCLLFPNRGPRPPRILIRSASAITGYVTVSPMQILWSVQVGPVPPGCRVEHSARIPAVSIACVNPEHGELVQPPHRRAAIQAAIVRHQRSRGAAAG
jgi:hypothetical protein